MVVYTYYGLVFSRRRKAGPFPLRRGEALPPEREGCLESFIPCPIFSLLYTQLFFFHAEEKGLVEGIGTSGLPM